MNSFILQTSQKPKLLDEVRNTLQTEKYSKYNTEAFQQNIRKTQELFGHKSVKSTMISTHVLNRGLEVRVSYTEFMLDYIYAKHIFK